MAESVAVSNRFPRQIRYIVGNEACERFSFYGMRSILVVFMVHHLAMEKADAKGVFHLFVSANYFLPLLGAYLADRFLGKYKTIMALSTVYCLGHLVLALFETKAGLYSGLALIALGAGGIKPCVSAHVGDQFNKSNSHLMQKVFELFYWSINFGSFFSTLLIPWMLPRFGSGWAFGLPGILMAVATWVFWLGRHEYVHVPPTGKEHGAQFFGIVFYALTHLGQKRSGESWLDVAKAKYPAEKVEGAKAAINIFKVFISVAAFWALFDQHSSTWILQAQKMQLDFMGMKLEASQIPALNPIMVMALIPLFSLGLYPMMDKLGFKMTPLRKMSIGMALAGASFVMVGFLENLLDTGTKLSVAWQFFPYLVITAAEVMVSITGLEFAYTQAPRSMKSTIMGLWLLTVAVGNFLTAIVSYLNKFTGAGEFYFYAALMFIVAAVFVLMATQYKEQSFIEDVGLTPQPA